MRWVRPRPSCRAYLELSPADDCKKAKHQDVVDDLQIRIDDRQCHGSHGQCDPTRANRQKQPLALAFRKRRLGELQSVLRDFDTSGRPAREVIDECCFC